ncbi:MAG: thiamine pyrophosphate-dependent dehydrogenase E1 component subunit alpha [Planctomycetota bacterium]|nr:thiamine pyrophosphate-dependent dehydrogenase E1 component subunit alpha [Planctomycetota bacterium]MDW8372921.1 thiamine pyrophosphate-dependent dehydrogenase E1 component subunit alpha [Planctomycetota bacterium]
MSDPELRRRLYRVMVLARACDDRVAALKAQGEIAGSAFLGRGQEAFSGAAGLCLRPGDVFAPAIRDQAARLAFGETPLDVMRVVLGRRTGWMRGRDGNIHRGDWSRGILPFISHLGAMAAPVAGVLLARRLGGRLGDTVGAIAIGEGGMNTGALHEALVVIGVERLPVVLLVADNCYAYSTPRERSYACRDLAERAAGYGFAAQRCDGTDADDCLRACQAAFAAARRGSGPQMVVADLLRLAGHGTHDDASYVPAELRSRYGDCLPLFERTLIREGVLSAEEAERTRAQCRAEVEAALQQARSEPAADAATDEWRVYSESDLLNLRWRR